MTTEQPQATILFLRVSGEQAVQSASEVLSRMLAGMIPPEVTATAVALPGPVSGLAAVEPAKRITKQRQAKFQKPDDEPDGFSGPAPAPSKAVGVIDRPQKVKAKTPSESGRPPGALASKIHKILDSGGGVAPLEHLIRETGSAAHGVNMAITKCPQLQRLDDGRIAIAGYRDTD